MAGPPGRQSVAPTVGAPPEPDDLTVPVDAAYAALRGGRDQDTDETMVLPRRVAEAAYALLRVLRDHDSAEVYDVLDRALGRQPRPERPLPCGSCGVGVGDGLPHAPECPSEEAVRVRSAPVPRVCSD